MPIEVVYHRGLLMADRQRDPVVEARAVRVWALTEEGKVVLLQRRISEGVCDYIAVSVEASGG